MSLAEWYFMLLWVWIGSRCFPSAACWVSCPNYLGEILVPRALSHHRWYRQRFPDYPAGRRALLPYPL